MSDDQTILEYARPVRRWRTRRVIMWSTLAMVTAAVLTLVLQFAPRYLRRASFLSTQRQSMNLSFPSGQVAYEEDHQQAEILSGGKTAGPGWTTLNSGTTGKVLAFYLRPDLVNQYIDLDANGPVMDTFSNFLFLHARKAKGGQERLVHVGVNYIFATRGGSEGKLSPGKAEEQHVLDWQVIRPGTFFSPAAQVASGSWGNKILQINMPRPLRIYAGQVDPADASHFTFQATTPQGTLTIDGWL